MTLFDAISLAVRAHGRQLDKVGQWYILHPLRVMLMCETDEERIVAVLHDVVEDTEVSLSMLTNWMFSPMVVDAVDALTRRKDESSAAYYKRVKANPLARRVKILDLTDNMNERRIPEMTPEWIDKMAYYRKRWEELTRVVK